MSNHFSQRILSSKTNEYILAEIFRSECDGLKIYSLDANKAAPIKADSEDAFTTFIFWNKRKVLSH